MAIVKQDFYTIIKDASEKMLNEYKKENPDFTPYPNGDTYFAGKLAEAVSSALSTYTSKEDTALASLNTATTALITALGGMSATPFAPLAAALVTWFGAYTAYLSAMKSGPDAPDSAPIVP
jgi:hypothetical protein